MKTAYNHDQLVVSKFGGTSMGDAACMLRSAEVSLKQGSKLVVVSATSGTTNDLIELATTAEKSSWEKASVIINKIKTRHEKIAADLELPESQLKIMNEIIFI